MSAPPPLYLGIDGGATHTLGVVVTPEGRVLAAARAGSLNFLGADLRTARRTLRDLLRALRVQLPPATPWARSVIGCAALFTDATPAEKRALCDGLLPLATTRVVSDCQTAHFGATLGRPGVVVIAGTGSIVLARGETGALAHAGGWGHLLGDEGSAWWIATESLRAAIAAQENRGPPTCLSRLACRFFQCSSLTAVAPLVHDGRSKDKVAALAAFLARHTPPSDRVFRAILHRAGRELAAQACAAARTARLQLRPLPVFLTGSVLQKNRRVRASCLAALRARTTVRLCTPALPPVLGAAALGLTDAGIALTRRVAATLRRSPPRP